MVSNNLHFMMLAMNIEINIFSYRHWMPKIKECRDYESARKHLVEQCEEPHYMHIIHQEVIGLILTGLVLIIIKTLF